MRIKKEGSENNPRFKMMEAGITLKEIEKWYGKATANALVQYCEINDKEIDQVAGSDREWDRFEMWAKSKKHGLGTNSGKFDDWQKASRIDDKGTGERAPKIYDRPVDSDIYGEGSGSRMNEWDIAGWLEEELADCEWVDDLKTPNDDYEDPWFEIDSDGSTYRITVKKVFAPREER